MPVNNKKTNSNSSYVRGENNMRRQTSDKQSKGRGKRRDYREIYQNPYTQKKVNPYQRMDIRGQTPTQRRQAKEQKRINPNETEIRYGARSRQDYRIKDSKNRKRNRKKRRRTVFARLGLFIVIFLSMAFIAWLAFFVSLTSGSNEIPGTVWISVGLQNVEKTDDTRDSGAKYFRDGTMYVDMTFLAKTYDMITTGDRDKLKYIFNENGEYAMFCVDTPVVYINGTPITLDSKTMIEDGKLYVPADFFNEYVNELEISFTDENNINVINIIQDSERNDNGSYVGKTLTLSLKKDTGNINIVEDGLSEEVKAQTYFMTYVPEGTSPATPAPSAP